MKKFALLLFLLPLLLHAQQPITMADAIMKGRSAFAPANLRQLQWIPGGTQFTYVAGTKLVRQDAAKPAVSDTLDWLPRLNEGVRRGTAR